MADEPDEVHRFKDRLVFHTADGLVQGEGFESRVGATPGNRGMAGVWKVLLRRPVRCRHSLGVER